MPLAAGDRVAFEERVAAHSQRDVNIPSAVAISLFLETNASYDLMQKYQGAARLPVRLEHKNGIDSVATVKGAGGGLYRSVNGVIPLIVKNETNESLIVRVIVEAKHE